MRSEKFFVYSIFIAAALLTGCLEKKENAGGPTVARFSGGTISLDEFKQRVIALPKEFRAFALGRKKEFAEEMVNERFLAKEAERRGLQKQPEVKQLLDAAYNKIIISKLVDTEIDKKIKIDPSEAEKYYETHKSEFMTPLLLRASHILVGTEEEAREIKKQLSDGADFEELARKKSLDNTAMRGGDVGFFQKGQLIPEFENTAMQLRKGEISDVVKSQFGYHVIKLLDRAEPILRDLKSVKTLVERQIFNQKRAVLYKEFVQKIRGESKVEIDEKVLESLATKAPSKN